VRPVLGVVTLLLALEPAGCTRAPTPQQTKAPPTPREVKKLPPPLSPKPKAKACDAACKETRAKAIRARVAKAIGKTGVLGAGAPSKIPKRGRGLSYESGPIPVQKNPGKRTPDVQGGGPGPRQLKKVPAGVTMTEELIAIIRDNKGNCSATGRRMEGWFKTNGKRYFREGRLTAKQQRQYRTRLAPFTRFIVKGRCNSDPAMKRVLVLIRKFEGL
jgi:hypothetical protein